MRQRRKAKEERSAGGVIFRRAPEGVHLLLIKDAYDNWGLPKGHIEPPESGREAAVREAQEETGLACTVHGEELMTIDWFFRSRGQLIHKYCQFFLMESRSGEPTPETGEGISECRWFPAAEAVREITYDNAREVLMEAVQILGADSASAKDSKLEDSE